MKISVGWEKRYWGGPKPTWRQRPSTLTRYPLNSKGPSTYCTRVISNKLAKKIIFK